MELATPEDLKEIKDSYLTPERVARAKKISCLTKTGTYTVSEQGRYKKKKLHAGNALRFVGHYQGKRNGVILQFECIVIGGIVEIALKDIPEKTSAYKDFLQALLKPDLYKKETRDKEEIMKEYEELYGNLVEWGAFS